MDFFTELFDISMTSLQHKTLRVVIVLAALVVCKAFIALVHAVNRRAMRSSWWVVQRLFSRPSQAVTINAVIIDTIKYAIYFTAFGSILAEFGIDTRTYLTSLSIIGVAVGFGAQGLVQDVVTGFFIIFEDQFAVGDMVELGGQTGIVEEIGLRATRIRNYEGAVVIFPNRSIATVGNYTEGAVAFYVDVAIPSRSVEAPAAGLLAMVGRELARQFPRVLLHEPESLGLLELETGEVFLRTRVLVWPHQQWVIDQQLVPRIKEVFKAHGIALPSDRIIVSASVSEPAVEETRVFERLRRAFQTHTTTVS